MPMKSKSERRIWTVAEVFLLRRLVTTGKYNYFEIAERMGRDRDAVAQKAGELGLRNPVYLKRITKHKHLRGRVMRYFLNHSFQETMDHFGLTRAEAKSIFTVGYRDPKYAHLRKDSRRKDSWSFEETMVLLRSAGLQPRTWIAKKLKRGGVHAVKEMIWRLKANTRYMNGLPRSLAEELIGHQIEGFKVKAGPSAPGVDCRPVIVPWVLLYSEAKKSKTIPNHFISALRAMARFQKRIHGTRGLNDTIASIERIIKGRL